MSLTRVFYVFPANLRAVNIALAVYQPKAGDSFKLVFRGTEGQPLFDISMQITSFVISNAQGGTSVAETDYKTGLANKGWAFIVTQIKTDIIVNSAGTYEVFGESNGQEQYIGTAVLAHAPIAPYTPEEVTA